MDRRSGDWKTLCDCIAAEKKEKEEWMQKFYVQLTDREVRDHGLNRILEGLEEEVRRLSAEVTVLQSEHTLLREAKSANAKELISLTSQHMESLQILNVSQASFSRELADLAFLLSSFQKKTNPRKSSPTPKKSTEFDRRIVRLKAKISDFASSLPTSPIGKQSSLLRLKAKSPKREKTSESISHQIEEMLVNIEARLQRAKALTTDRSSS